MTSLKRSDFTYELPRELIAQTPAEKREQSRMMVLYKKEGSVQHAYFKDIARFLSRGDLLVLNNTRVIPARLFGEKDRRGGKVEVLLLRELSPFKWKAMVRPGRRLRIGSVVRFNPSSIAVVKEILEDGTRVLEFDLSESMEEFLDKEGVTPLPPYIKREYDEDESFHRKRYQTVYAQVPGSVAAPTAGLHFTDSILEELYDKGIETVDITLHVGMGTFRPVQVENIENHKMDEEFYSIPSESAAKIRNAQIKRRRIIAVGTTATRALESSALKNGGLVTAEDSWTSLFIHTPFTFNVIGGLLTNFHLPGSTLLMLVSAFAGRKQILSCYDEAVRKRYRFYSYGDCMLIL